MMTRADIINGLEDMGYETVAQDKIKNGVICKGICIIDRKSQVQPIIYIEALLKEAKEKGYGIERVIFEILNIYREAKKDLPDCSMIFERGYVLEHIYVGMQKSSQEALIKRESEFEGIEEYLYIRHEKGSAKVNQEYLKKAQVLPGEAWQVAIDNTVKDAKNSEFGNDIWT